MYTLPNNSVAVARPSGDAGGKPGEQAYERATQHAARDVNREPLTSFSTIDRRSGSKTASSRRSSLAASAFAWRSA